MSPCSTLSVFLSLLPILVPLPYLHSRLPLLPPTLVLLSALLYNCSVPHKNHRGSSISTQIYNNWMIIRTLCFFFSLGVCMWESLPFSRLVCQVLVTFSASTVYMSLNEEELSCKSQILSLKTNHCVCFAV